MASFSIENILKDCTNSPKSSHRANKSPCGGGDQQLHPFPTPPSTPRFSSYYPGLTPRRQSPHPSSRRPTPYPIQQRPFGASSFKASQYPGTGVPRFASPRRKDFEKATTTPAQCFATPLSQTPMQRFAAPQNHSQTPMQRFAVPLSQKDLDKATEKFVPPNTKKNNIWATKVYNEWLTQRNQATCEQLPNILEYLHGRTLTDKVLAAFVLESRRKDGRSYPPNTLRNILGSLFRVMKENFGASNVISFMDSKTRERDYPRLHNAMDRHFRDLRASGIGAERKQASIITADDEKQMWAKGVLGSSSPKVLLQTIFFLNGKNFCLRGRKEHHTLRLSQVVRSQNPDKYTYCEYGSKNHHGGVNDNTEGKVVTIVDTGSPFSHVALLDFYISKCPKLDSPDPPFYLRPYPYTPLNGPWFFETAAPVKMLNSLVKDMTTEAGLTGNYTNHSLRATGATLLFDAGVPEAVIQRRTGHKSLEALRCYERTTETQIVQVSSLLDRDSALDMTTEEFQQFVQPD